VLEKNELEAVRKITGLRTDHQESHYLQHVILFLLKDEPFIFKGGTCLWFFYGLPRFSEDLDFTAKANFSDDLPQKIIRKMARFFGIYSILKSNCRTADALTFIIEARGPYYTSPATTVKISIEISERERVQLTPNPAKLEYAAYKIPASIISCMHIQEISCEKTRAIMTRDKSRDVFDLWHVIKNYDVFFDENMVNIKLQLPIRKAGAGEIRGRKFSFKQFYNKVMEKEQHWERDLSQIVFTKLPKFEKCSKVVLNWARGQR